MSRGITGHSHLDGYDKSSMTSRKRTLNLMRILKSANKMSTMLAKRSARKVKCTDAVSGF